MTFYTSHCGPGRKCANKKRYSRKDQPETSPLELQSGANSIGTMCVHPVKHGDPMTHEIRWAPSLYSLDMPWTVFFCETKITWIDWAHGLLMVFWYFWVEQPQIWTFEHPSFKATRVWMLKNASPRSNLQCKCIWRNIALMVQVQWADKSFCGKPWGASFFSCQPCRLGSCCYLLLQLKQGFTRIGSSTTWHIQSWTILPLVLIWSWVFAVPSNPPRSIEWTGLSDAFLWWIPWCLGGRQSHHAIYALGVKDCQQNCF